MTQSSILVDTCVLIWDALSPRKLSLKAKEVLRDSGEQGGLLIGDFSLWEVAMLMHKGRLNPGTSYRHFMDLALQSRNYRVVPVTPEIADQSVKLPDEINQDPVDRILVATSIVHQAPLVTGDRNLLRAGCVSTIW